jgi:hypothetical protein
VKAAYDLVPPEQIAAFLFTDGSGHADGFAGSGLRLMIPGKPAIVACAAETHSSTERGEFVGLLRGLAIFTDQLGWTKRQIEDARYTGKLHICWVTDRESLALAVARDPTKQDLPYYSRRSTPDLWASFEYFEQFLHVHALFTKRCSNFSMDQADMMASDSRQTLKNFYLSHFNEDKI